MKKTLALLALAGTLAMQTASAATLIEDIAYGPDDRNKLDLHLPDGVTDAPIVAFVHGGRWFRGDKSQVELYNRIQSLTNIGIGIASINYTYTTEEVWPKQIDDVMSALNFLTENGATYGYDGGNMAIWGQSSGAHLALWAGLKSAEDPNVDLKSVVSWYAPSDLYNITLDRVADSVPGENERFPEPSPESLLIDLPVPDNKAEADAASPTVYVQNLARDAALPDFQLAHGTEDFVISPLQSQRLYDALFAQGGASNVELHMVAGAGHGGDLFNAQTRVARAFLANSLGVAPIPVPGAIVFLLTGLLGIGAVSRRRS